MTDPFDEELRRALQAGVQQRLKGWTFTPEMQRKVMERIQLEGSATDSAPQAEGTPLTRRVLRPAAWTAAAAAAVLVMVNLGLHHRPMGSPNSGANQTASTEASGFRNLQSGVIMDGLKASEGADSARLGPTDSAASADQFETAEASVPARSTGGVELSGPTAAAEVGAESGAAQVGSTGGAKGPALMRSPGEADAGSNEGKVAALMLSPGEADEASGEGEVAALLLSPGEADEASGEGEVAALMLPPGEADEASGEAEVRAFVRSSGAGLAAEGKQVSLPVPAIPPAREPARVLMLAAGPEGDADAPGPDSTRVERTETGVRLVDQTGAILWERSLAGPSGAGHLAVAPDGEVAASFGEELFLLDRSGEVVQHFHLPDPPMEVLWAGEERLAVAEFQGVTVYQNGAVLWSAPLTAEGMAQMESRLLVWNGDEASALNLSDGLLVWQATPEQPGAAFSRAVVSADGELAALLAGKEDGWILWVLDQDGQVLLSQGLSAEPHLRFAEDTLLVEADGEVQSLPISR